MQETPVQVQGSEVEFQVVSMLEASDVALNAKRGWESGFEAAWRREISKVMRKRKRKGLAAAIVVCK